MSPRAACRLPIARRGITLVELFLTLGVLSSLIGLLLPAVQKVRQAATQMNVDASLRPLGVEVLAHSGVVAILDADSIAACQRILRNRSVAAGNVSALLPRYAEAMSENARLIDLADDALEIETDPNRITLLTNTRTALVEFDAAIARTFDQLERLVPR